ncbi:MAG: hypothetical protein ACAI35_13130 [Candidatus Methylacidiphilales bacterium]|nr:hypothetical protein [Candidatus Methylacidiphilales bacterium]
MAPTKARSAEEIVRNYSLRLRLARSAELALAGSLLNAEDVLMPDGKIPETAEELDLLARILVRQERYAEAETRWKDALRISKDKDCYQEALNSLNSYVKSVQKNNKFVMLLSTAILVIVVTVLVYILIRQIAFSAAVIE